MESFRAIAVLSLISLCLCSLPASSYGEVKQFIYNVYPQDSSNDGEVIIRKNRGLNAMEEQSEDDLKSDIYWRTWKGKVPKDAVIGGYVERECGSYPIFMAQVYKTYNSPALVPVQIFRRSKAVTYSYAGSAATSKKDIQILCAEDPSILTWVARKDAEKFNITAEEDCVTGGTEQETMYSLQTITTFFGRTKYEDENIIGKVLQKKKIMYFPYYGEEKSTGDYEILCYETAVRNRKTEALRKEMEQEKKTEGEKKQEEVKN